MITPKHIISNIKRVFHKPFDTSTAEGRSNERMRRIALTALAAAVSKVFQTIIPFITIRITLDYLGVEIYGLWNTITSFFAIFVFADLGLGNGLQTLLSKAFGKNDISLQQKIINNTYFILFCIAAILVALLLLLYPFINWSALMNATTNTTQAIVGVVILSIVIPKFISIPFSLIQRIQLAYQEGYNSHLWQCFASILNLLCIYIISKADLGKVTLIATTASMPLIMFVLNSCFYYHTNSHQITFSRHYLERETAKNLLNTGLLFFFLSIVTTIGLSIDTFIVAHIGSLSEATPYSILTKIATLISLIASMISTPLWSANGEAIARGEIVWVKRNTKKVAILSLVFAVTMSLILIIIAPFAFKLWLGENFSFSIFCLTGMCIMQILLSFVAPYFMVLNSIGMVKAQIFIFAIFVVASILLKVILASFFGTNIIPWVSAICYASIIIPFILRKVHLIYRQYEQKA